MSIAEPTIDGDEVITVPISGLTCDDCARDVRRAIEALPGVRSADVRLTAQKAIIRHDPSQIDLPAIRTAVEAVGYRITDPADAASLAATSTFTRRVLLLLGTLFGLVLFIAVVGEVLGVFDAVTEGVPRPIWIGLILAGGYPIFRGVLRASLRRQVTSHTLMTIGMLAAVAVGEWATALLVVFFMRMADYVENFTAERARRAVRDLTAMAPQTARVEREGQEHEMPIDEVRVGDTVIVRPGEQIPIDGEVVRGQATVNQAAITGESMPIEAGPGSRVFAASFAQLGSLRIRATEVGTDTTFGRVIALVEEAEAHRADVQRLADRFATWYMPVVVTIAALTFLLSGNALATAAVLVVACSCSFALATPIAVIASVGASAKRGLLIKGGKYLEALSRADVLLIDKTGTLTLGQPQITNVITLNGMSQDEFVALAATAERYSEHPLAGAVRTEAQARGIVLAEPQQFEAIPGLGIRARVEGREVVIGNPRLIASVDATTIKRELEEENKTLLFVARDQELIGILAAADTLRPEVPQAIDAVRGLGVQHIELLTGDNERVAAGVAAYLGVAYRAGLLPEDKIAVVKDYQARGHTVVMVGDGVNDAPALAQADVGIAMGAAGSGVAIEAAHITLMREDWTLVPEAMRIARRTMRIVKLNLGFTVAYNMIGLSLAAFGIIPPAIAAAAQSVPDIGILGNSSRLLRQQDQRHR